MATVEGQSVAKRPSYAPREVLRCSFSTVVLVLLATLAVSRAEAAASPPASSKATECSSFPPHRLPTIIATRHRPMNALFSSSLAFSFLVWLLSVVLPPALKRRERRPRSCFHPRLSPPSPPLPRSSYYYFFVRCC